RATGRSTAARSTCRTGPGRSRSSSRPAAPRRGSRAPRRCRPTRSPRRRSSRRRSSCPGRPRRGRRRVASSAGAAEGRDRLGGSGRLDYRSIVMSEKVPMTPEGQARLREELKKLKEVELPQVVKDIGTAREHGDLSENAEYHAARERQGMIVARISYIEQSLSRAEVIDPSKIQSSKVQFGARLRLANAESGDEVTYQIVGPEEANVDDGRISVASPLARAMLGREV